MDSRNDSSSSKEIVSTDFHSFADMCIIFFLKCLFKCNIHVVFQFLLPGCLHQPCAPPNPIEPVHGILGDTAVIIVSYHSYTLM